MEEFYNLIVNITKTSGYQNLLIKDSQLVFDTIMKDYRNNIQLAASQGRNEAYICIYEIGAKIGGIVPIDSFVRMTNPKLIEKFEEFKLEPVVERIKKKINPFRLEIKLIDIDQISTEDKIKNQELVGKIDQNNKIIGILVSWPLE